jgi:hypothetical protein
MIKRVTKETVKEALVAAIKLPENRFEDGSLNWNFIDADAYIEVLEPYGRPDPQVTERDKEKFYEYFDELVSEIPPDLRPKATHKYGRFW